MNRKIKAIGIAVCVLLVTAGAVLPVERTLNVDRDIITKQITSGKTDSLAGLGEISRYFTMNCGQINAEAVKYYIQDGGVWLLENSVAFYIREPYEVSNAQGHPESKSEFGGETGEAVRDGVVLKVNYEGANHVDPKGQGILPHRSNFFYGENSIEWRSGVPNYQEVVYPNIYDNIDLIFQDSQRGLKYSFVVHPGGNPSDIRMRYEGIEKLDIDSSGNLTIRTRIGVLTDSELFIYQYTGQDENEVEGRFAIIDSATYGFEISECYDKDKDLFIDPLLYSTLLGGVGSEEGYGIAVDESGKVYVTGYTDSVDFPTTAGAYDITYNVPWRNVFVFKLNPDSTIPPNQQLIYSTYIGAEWTDSVGCGITVDSVGNAYVTGEWGESIFVLKLNPNGNDLVYKRYYGTGCGRDIIFKSGSKPNRVYLESKPNEHIYVTGYASSLSTKQGAYQPSNKGSKDAFVLKLDPANGDTLYGSCFGGSDLDRGFGIAVDGSGKVYVTGETYSDNFPVKPEGYVYQESKKGGCDAFVFILQPQGNGANDLFYSSYLGGNMKDWGNGIALRPWGSTVEVYITGITESNDFPYTPNAYDKTYNSSDIPHNEGDVFVVKFVPSPNAPGDDDLKYSTYIGGQGRDEGLDIVVDSGGNAYVTGYANSDDFPVTPNAFDGSYNGSGDVFVLKLRIPSPSPFPPFGPKLKYSTYIGGESREEGHAISLGPGGVYITGGTWKQSVFPTTSGAYQTTQKGEYDVFVVKTECPTTSFYQLMEYTPI